MTARRVLIAALLAAAPASAYEFGGAKWDRGDMPVRYVVSNRLTTDVPDAEALAAVQLGYQVWTDLPCSYMRWDYGGRTENQAWGASDGENVASWRESGWDDAAQALAITAAIWTFQGNLQDTDIKFNGVNHQWAALREAPAGFDGRTDIASVCAHEAGHAIGLGHTNVPGSTMWPSTGPGDVSGRSLGADDIEGACAIYPSGGDVPDPEVDPPPAQGDVQFGGDCSREACAGELFCVSDGRESFCSRGCRPGDDCGDGYYCAQLSQGGGACARGEDPAGNVAGFGEQCGANVPCEQGLFCVNDQNSFYCSGPCLSGACPTDYFCTQLQNGGDACARGDGGSGELPGFGSPCGDRNLCANGLFCLNDPYAVDEQAGRAVPYCTNDCPGSTCDEGFRCVDVAPDGRACQRIPTAGERRIGDTCWVNPEAAGAPPECGGDLICVDYQIQGAEVVEAGTCTRNCKPDDCCPAGYGCVELTPVFAQCRSGQTDSPAFACAGDRPPINGGGGADGGGGELPGADGGITRQGGGGEESGLCSASRPAGLPVGALPALAGLVLLVLGLRRRGA